jgi:hypothetical protein
VLRLEYSTFVFNPMGPDFLVPNLEHIVHIHGNCHINICLESYFEERSRYRARCTFELLYLVIAPLPPTVHSCCPDPRTVSSPRIFQVWSMDEESLANRSSPAIIVRCMV